MRLKLQALLRSKSGNVLALAAFSMPVLIGFAGLGTDTIQWTVWKRDMQRSADSAALNGAYTLAQSGNVTLNVKNDLIRTLDFTTSFNPVIENAPTAGAYAGNFQAVRVVLQHSRSLPFSGFFLSSAPVFRAEATAAILQNGNYCVISLENTTATGVTFTGNATVNLGCGVATNSTGSNAVDASGSSSVNASPIAAVGGLAASSNYTGTTTLLPDGIPQADPFATLPDPVPTGCSAAVSVSNHAIVNLMPGCYNGIDVHGTLFLSPGVYYVNGNSLSANATANIIGSGVTIILTGPDSSNIASLSLNGGANINLSAPSIGTYAGVTIYKDRRSPSTTTDTINGGSNIQIQGAIYTPSQSISFSGNSSITYNCLQIISRTITFTGNTNITNNCPAGSGSQSFKGTQVRLVG